MIADEWSIDEERKPFSGQQEEEIEEEMEKVLGQDERIQTIALVDGVFVVGLKLIKWDDLKIFLATAEFYCNIVRADMKARAMATQLVDTSACYDHLRSRFTCLCKTWEKPNPVKQEVSRAVIPLTKSNIIWANK